MIRTHASPGFSDAARFVRETVDSQRQHLEQTQTLGRRDLMEELGEISDECRHEDWDGQGARAISQDTLREAYCFIESLPADLPAPSLAPEADGQISFEWLSGTSRILSVSVGDPGEIHYAAKIGPSRTRGTEAFFSDFPQLLKTLIRKICYR